MAVYVLRLQVTAAGSRTAMSFERRADLLVHAMRFGGM